MHLSYTEPLQSLVLWNGPVYYIVCPTLINIIGKLFWWLTVPITIRFKRTVTHNLLIKFNLLMCENETDENTRCRCAHRFNSAELK